MLTETLLSGAKLKKSFGGFFNFFSALPDGTMHYRVRNFKPLIFPICCARIIVIF